jgi:phenylpyruvate tautomerase PptA (4-oxalocrotonate tautomerase family)
MPVIQVKSLPLPPTIQISDVVEGLTKDFADHTGIGREHVSVTWESISPGHYAVGGKVAMHQPEDSHPILVDLLVPDFNSSEKVEQMLHTIAQSISRLTKIPNENVFINCRYATSAMVFDAGEVVRW